MAIEIHTGRVRKAAKSKATGVPRKGPTSIRRLSGLPRPRRANQAYLAAGDGFPPPPHPLG